MLIIGCDFHTRYQLIAMMDEATRELIERRLDHESGRPRPSIAICRGQCTWASKRRVRFAGSSASCQNSVTNFGWRLREDSRQRGAQTKDR